MFFPDTILDGLADNDDSEIDDFFYQCPMFVVAVKSSIREVHIVITGRIYSDLSKYATIFNAVKNLNKSFIIRLFINSPGGALTTTYAILSVLNASPAKVITHNIGLAASCGSLLLCEGDEIAISDNTITMFHNASGFFMGDVNVSSVKATLCIKMIESITDGYITRGILTENEVKEIVKGKEYWFTADQIRERLAASNILHTGV